ncbi:MAG: hypothetical protein HZB51_09870 [Chloroflexi bacterium]|nr:hypothetical protein [Chloroflexota bacterium]
MPEEKGGVHISGGSVHAGRDIVGGNSYNIDHVQTVNFLDWRAQMDKQIDAQTQLAPADKQDLKDTVAKIADEGAKGKQANPGRIEKLINTLAAMAPDIFEVATTTLANPLAGIGLTLKKIGDKAKLEQAK